jgi:hypothetical protein
MSDSLILDALTSVPVLLKEYEFPQLRGDALIQPRTDLEHGYYLLGTNNELEKYATESELFILTAKGTKARIAPKQSEKSGTYGRAIEFEFTGDKQLLIGDGGVGLSCQVYTIGKVSLYDRESWSVGNQLRYQQAVVASQKTEWMANPINILFYTLNLAQESIEQWKQAKSSYSSDFTIVTPEYIDEQIEQWQQVQIRMQPLVEYAVEKGITNPLTPEVAAIEQRTHRIKAIYAALDIAHSDVLERMNVEQIDKIFNDISTRLGDRLPEVPQPSAPEALPEGKHQDLDTLGTSANKESRKSGKSSPKSSPPETTT